jgi:hypothetical protein
MRKKNFDSNFTNIYEKQTEKPLFLKKFKCQINLNKFYYHKVS